MLEKIKNLSLVWKVGMMILIALVVVEVLLLLYFGGKLNGEFKAFYGDASTKGFFVAELLADELKPAIEKNTTDIIKVQQTVDTYKDVYGIYGVRYIFVLDSESKVIADTFNGMVPQSLIDINPLSEEKAFKPFKAGGKPHVDCLRPLPLADQAVGAVRIGMLDQNSESPVWQDLKTEHISRIIGPTRWIMFFLFMVLTAVFTLSFWYFIVRRISALIEAAERMSFGDLETVVEMKSQAEIGVLEDTLERMRMNLKDAIERLKRRK